MQDPIQGAIENRLIIEFNYHGHYRYAEPHVLGVHDGDVQVLCYQLDGTSSSGLIPEWRRFSLSDISGFSVTDDEFPGRRPGPTGRHSEWDYIIAIVQ